MGGCASQLDGLVTVVTPTRRRPALLSRAIESVQRQCCQHVRTHIIMVDDCSDTWLALGRDLPATVWPRWAQRGPDDRNGPRRIASVRDVGTELAQTPWVAYLDDDNQWDETHLHSLLMKARESGSPAVHSWARVIHPDGEPYLEQRDPWAFGEENGRREYQRMKELGVVEPGSNVFKDRVDAHDGPTSVRSVDQSAWLLETELVRGIRFSNMSRPPDRTMSLGEDDLFNENLLAKNIRICATEQATLIYQLGGYSTAPEANEPADW